MGRIGSAERANANWTGPPHLSRVHVGGHHGAERADVEELAAHPRGDRVPVVALRQLLGLHLDPGRVVRLLVGRVQDRPFGHIDPVPRTPVLGHADVVADLALDGDVAHEALAGFRIDPGEVPGVRIAVRVPVRNIEKQHEFVAVGERVHASSPGVSSWRLAGRCSDWW